jgi:hypothetical protein
LFVPEVVAGEGDGDVLVECAVEEELRSADGEAERVGFGVMIRGLMGSAAEESDDGIV